MKAKDFTRREFIKTTGAVAAGTALIPTLSCSSSPFDPKDIPTTILGKTGVTIPRMILGLGSRFMAASEEVGLQVLETAFLKIL